RTPARPTLFPYTTLFRSVAAGLAAHLGLPVTAVRLAFVVLLGVNGLGALLYAVFWAVLPPRPGVARARRDLAKLLLFAVLAVVVDRKSTRLNSSHVKISY